MNSLFGQDWTGLKQVAAQRRVLVDYLRSCRRTLQVQVADDDIQESSHCGQLHAVKHSWELVAETVEVRIPKNLHRRRSEDLRHE